MSDHRSSEDYASTNAPSRENGKLLPSQAMDASQRATEAASQAVEQPVVRPTTPPRRTAELTSASAIESKNYSTPTRARQDKTDHTCDSVDDELEGDLEKYAHKGIDPAKFLQLAFNLSTDEYAALEKKVKEMKFYDDDEYERSVQMFKHEMSMAILAYIMLALGAISSLLVY